MILSLAWRVEDQSWLLLSAATNSLIVSIRLLFLDHLLRCQRLFRWVPGSDHCQGLDISLCPGLLLESPLATCGSLALIVPVLCSSSCLSKFQFLNSSSRHQRKNLPLSMFLLRDQFNALCSSIWTPRTNFFVPGLVDKLVRSHQRPSPRTNFLAPGFVQPLRLSHLPSPRTKSSPMILSLAWRVEDQSWLLLSAASNSLIVSIPLLFLDHLLRCQRLFRWVPGSDHCQGLDISLCPGRLLESPLATCGSLALIVPILCSSSCLSKFQFLNSSSRHQRKNLPLSMFLLRDQLNALCSSIWTPRTNFFVPGLVDKLVCSHQRPSPRTNFLAPGFVQPLRLSDPDPRRWRFSFVSLSPFLFVFMMYLSRRFGVSRTQVAELLSYNPFHFPCDDILMV